MGENERGADPAPADGDALRTVGQLAASVDALAALAAHLRVESEGLEVDPEVRALLASIADELLGDTSGLSPATRAAIVGMARAFTYQASDLIAQPARAHGWDDTDESLLQSIGQVSMGIVAAVGAAAAAHPALAARLDHDEAVFVDVGTGTGWLAIAMARAFPSLRVVGCDIFEPALDLARRNVEAAGLTDRVELRRQDAADLEPGSADVVWLPMPFLPADAVEPIMASAVAALRPGGWLLPGTFPGPGESLPEKLMALRTLRSGGHPWTAEELVATMARRGLLEVGEVPRTWAPPVRLYAGCTPAG